VAINVGCKVFRMIAPRSTVIRYCTTERISGQPR
jgi:hypothetical protein